MMPTTHKKIYSNHLLIPIILITAAMMLPSTLRADSEFISHSFMFTRPGYAHLNMEQGLWHDLVNRKHGALAGGLHVVGFYEKSISVEKSALYFLPTCHTPVSVIGDTQFAALKTSNQTITRDIRAEWLGLSPEFQGTLTLNPTQTQAGAIIEYNQNVRTLLNIDFFKNAWVSIVMPVVHVENDLNLQQTIQHNAPNPGGPQDIIQAFRQPSWQYSHISGKNSLTRIAEIRLEYGNALVDKDFFQISYSSIFVIPTGNKQCAQEMFDPVVGNNKHYGIGASIFFQFPLNRDTTYGAFCFFTGLEAIFLVKNKQYRTYDLQDFNQQFGAYIKKPWSRFMLFNEKNGQQNIPGVNVLTRHTLVHPYGLFDFTTGWRLKYECLEAEFGFDIWGKARERLEIRPYLYNDPCSCYSLFGIAGLPVQTNNTQDGTIQNTSASLSTISTQAGQNQQPGETFDMAILPGSTDLKAIFIPIEQTQLDLHSAAAESSLNYKFHMTLGAILPGKKTDVMCGGGFFLDIPHKNSALHMWGIWSTFGVTF
jgi:hypothetical protein